VRRPDSSLDQFCYRLLAADTPGQRWFWRVVGALAVVALSLIVAWQVLVFWREAVIEHRISGLRELIVRHARRNDLEPLLVECIVRCESGGDPRAQSSRDAKGLMQVTADAESDVLRRFRWEAGDLFDPDYNLSIGSAFLARLLRRFDGDLVLAVAAYHMGQSKVANLRATNPTLDSRELIEAYGGPQTRSYTARVLALYEAKLADAARQRVPGATP
jgi:soluble lytic murein transglycosylase